MKICTKCNHVLRDDETVCPYCAESASVQPIGSGEPAVSQEDEIANAVDIVDEVNYATATIELPAGFWKDADILSDTIDTSFPDEAFPQPAPPKGAAPAGETAADAPAKAPAAQEPAPAEPAPAAEPPAADVPAEPALPPIPDLDPALCDVLPDLPLAEEPAAAVGDLEKEAKRLEKDSRAPRRDLLGKIGVTAVAVLLCALFVFVVSCLVRYMKGPSTSDDQKLLESISGEWVSAPFVYADDTSHGYVELFQINKDGTFTLKHLIPDTKDEKGYLDGNWQVDYQISGTVEVIARTKCVLLTYKQFGQEYYFDRYIVDSSDTALTLREYYDDAKTESYDIAYTRVS